MLSRALLATALLPGVNAAEDRWSGLDPQGADLIYAAPAETGSAGMFGHVLIRVRGINGTIAISYAADIGDDHPLELAWKGLTGGYTAGYGLEPWIQEQRGYQITEGRPLWAYPLRIDRDGLDRLLARVADQQVQRTPYHLLSGNCAGGIADLLETTQPGSGLRERLASCTSPAGVVRAAHEAGLLGAGSRLPGPGSDRCDPIDDPPAGRIAVGAGWDGASSYGGLSWRPAWHAPDDRRGSIALGDTLETLAVEVRLQQREERLVLHRATLISVTSCAQPPTRPLGWTWQADLGSRRERRGPDGLPDQEASLAGGMGASWAPDANALVWLSTRFDLRLVDDFAEPAGGCGAAGGVILGLGGCVADLRAQALRWEGQPGRHQLSAQASLTLPLGPRSGFMVAVAWQDAWGWRASTLASAWQLYF